jgi:thymidine kinase
MSTQKTEGEIQLIFGPMFSGKTTELLRRIKRYKIANRICLLIKYRVDDRYSNENVSTHDKQMCKAKPVEHLRDALEEAFEAQVIGIDEGQFFPAIVEFCELLASRGKIVIVAALDGTFERKPFGKVLELVPLAEKVTKLSAICYICKKDASFTWRLGNEKKVEVIGGDELYTAVCRTCYQNVQDNKKAFC